MSVKKVECIFLPSPNANIHVRISSLSRYRQIQKLKEKAVSTHLSVLMLECDQFLSLTCAELLKIPLVPVVYLNVVNKDELTPKMRPMSNDAGNSNPNVSDLMDEFIQERLRARGNSVRINT